jgi:two-component sensor histidine kinase
MEHASKSGIRWTPDSAVRGAPGAGPGVNPAPIDARVSWSRCEAALAGSKITILAADLRGRLTWVFNPTTAFPNASLGRTDIEAFAGPQGKTLAAARVQAVSSGGARELELAFASGHAMRWYEVSIRPHRENGKLVGTVAAFVDITDRKVQEEHLRIVLRELAHRSKNLLAVIQGIARQTAAGGASTVQEFLNRFNGRIFSLSRAHDVLIDADWRGARIFDLVRSQIALYAEGRLAAVVIEGENGFLRPNAAQYVGLALHELTTNAVKYGALSRPDGAVVVRFEESGGGQYRFSWKESGSVPVREPGVPSFGLMMLTEVIPTSVGGSAKLVFEPQGLRYVLDIPAAQLLA